MLRRIIVVMAAFACGGGALAQSVPPTEAERQAIIASGKAFSKC